MSLMDLVEVDLEQLARQLMNTPAERINITEQQYLDLAIECKNKIEEKDHEIDRVKHTLMNYKFIFAKIFGNILMLDELLGGMDFESNIQFAIVRHALEFIIAELKTLYEIEI